LPIADSELRLALKVKSSRVSKCERRGEALYPPRILPSKVRLGRLDFLATVIREPLHTLPPAVYQDPILVRESPVFMVSACAPEAVRTVVVDRRQDFNEKPPIQRYILGHLLGNGLLLAEGSDWRWQRQTVAPLFRHSELLNYVPVMVGAATATLENWRENAGCVHDISADMTRATYEVIAKTILVGGGERISQTTGDLRQRYMAAIRWATTYGLLNLPAWVPRPGRSYMNYRDNTLRQIADEMIEGHEEQEEDDSDDLLGRLIRARRTETGQPMTRTQLIDNILTFLLAGHHTTSAALTWTLYLLACAPEWQERLHKEIRAVAPEGPVTPEHIDRLVLVQQVLKESMRLFPPVPFQSRVATNDTELCGQRIKKGTLISIPIYAVHRHESAWADADRFDPTRFEKGNEPSVASCKFLPFGAGPRICIGSAFALIEATVFLALFLRAAHFALPEPDFIPIPSSAVMLTPKQGMPLKVTVRS
jgi:cytochrome P450